MMRHCGGRTVPRNQLLVIGWRLPSGISDATHVSIYSLTIIPTEPAKPLAMKPIELVNATLIKSRIFATPLQPRKGILTLETSEGLKRMKIDEESANDLLDEILAFFGVPRVS